MSRTTGTTRPLPSKCFATLLTNASYLPGVLVLNQSLQANKSQYPLIALITSNLGEDIKQALGVSGVQTIEFKPLVIPANEFHEHDKRFIDAWQKLSVFGLVGAERVILLDCDMVVRKNIDDLFDLDLPQGWIAASPACTCNPRKLSHYPSSWIPATCAFTPLTPETALTHPLTPSSNFPDPGSLLNGGLIVLKPSTEDIEALQSIITSPLASNFKFPDQDAIAYRFRGRWRSLPYAYNAIKTARRVHGNCWRDEDVKCLHYIMEKPWATPRPPLGESTDGEFDLVNRWWWESFDRLQEGFGTNRGAEAEAVWTLVRSLVSDPDGGQSAK